MRAFNIIQNIITASPQYGHAMRNMTNKRTLQKSNAEFAEMFKGIK